MIIFKTASQLSQYLQKQPAASLNKGFVPTMGALHRGHLSLIEASRKANELSICSIFVNPTQFNDPKDFEKYPVTIDTDIHQLENAGTDILYLPSVHDIYPNGTGLDQQYDLGFLESVFEGKYRPGHFQGVCQVVHRLLNIVQPQNLYLGQKDYQQCMVIIKLIELMGAKEMIGVNICPTLREADGLAMSSRNMRLSAEDRITATAIYKALNTIKSEVRKGDLRELQNKAENLLLSKGFKVDYIEIADAITLEKVSEWNGERKLVALAAAFLHEVRLIDNIVLN
jgi:pantoate--beta-alanine ligase